MSASLWTGSQTLYMMHSFRGSQNAFSLFLQNGQTSTGRCPGCGHRFRNSRAFAGRAPARHRAGQSADSAHSAGYGQDERASPPRSGRRRQVEFAWRRRPATLAFESRISVYGFRNAKAHLWNNRRMVDGPVPVAANLFESPRRVERLRVERVTDAAIPGKAGL